MLSLGKSAKATWEDGNRTRLWFREAGSRKISEVVVEGHLYFTERMSLLSLGTRAKNLDGKLQGN